MSINYKN